MATIQAACASEIKRIQLHHFTETLNSMRNENKADFTLIAGHRHFPVHKLVLEANCPYFEGMFQSDMVETSSGKVVFEDIEPETLEIVLDFMYLGEVSKMTSEDRVLNVLAASHMMQLDSLFQYCCQRLTEFMTPNNFHDIWKAAEKYSRQDVCTTVLHFVILNIDEVIHDPEFLLLSIDKVKDLLKLANRNPEVIDKVTLGLVKWLCHDLDERGECAGELLAHVNPNFVNHKIVKKLLENEIDTLPLGGLDILNKMEGLSLISGDYNRDNNLVPTSNDECLGVKLVFFSEYRIERRLDPLLKRYVKCKILDTCVQSLDLYSMKWLPPQKLPSMTLKGTAMCQHEDKIYVVGGNLKSFYVIFDIATNSIECVRCTAFDGKANGVLRAIKGQLYFVDRDIDGGFCGITIFNPGEYDVLEETELHGCNFGTVVASTNFLYVYYNFGEEPLKFSCRFSIQGERMKQERYTEIPNIPTNVPAFFVVSGNCSYGLYQENDELVRLKYDYWLDRWTAKKFTKTPAIIQEVIAVYRSSLDLRGIVLVTTGSNSNQIPDYLVDPERCTWTKLPAPSGQCCIPDDESVQKTYFVENYY